jgi:hypothetical protein
MANGSRFSVACCCGGGDHIQPGGCSCSIPTTLNLVVNTAACTPWASYTGGYYTSATLTYGPVPAGLTTYFSAHGATPLQLASPAWFGLGPFFSNLNRDFGWLRYYQLTCLTGMSLKVSGVPPGSTITARDMYEMRSWLFGGSNTCLPFALNVANTTGDGCTLSGITING